MQMKRLTTISLALATIVCFAAPIVAPANAAAPGKAPPRQSWSFAGAFGTYDRAQLQRGFQVYREACQSCHSISRVAFRNLAEPGGPQFTVGQVAALAAEYEIDAIDDQGEPIKRPGVPADRFPKLFANDAAAVAAHGAVPPDLSVMAKARSYSRGFPWFVLDALPLLNYQEHGVDYLAALLTGYTNPDDLNWNEYFPGNRIAMARPLAPNQIEYTDGTPGTVEQYARDVTAFMMWTAEPKMEERKRTGFSVMVFLFIFAGLMYFTKKKIWAREPH